MTRCKDDRETCAIARGGFHLCGERDRDGKEDVRVTGRQSHKGLCVCVCVFSESQSCPSLVLHTHPSVSSLPYSTCMLNMKCGGGVGGGGRLCRPSSLSLSLCTCLSVCIIGGGGGGVLNVCVSLHPSWIGAEPPDVPSGSLDGGRKGWNPDADVGVDRNI